jgi:hypothetical protein
MRRLLLPLTMVAMLAGAAPAPASDAQIERTLGRTLSKISYLSHRMNPDRPQSLARFAARLARAARLAGHRLARSAPSTREGADGRHVAVVALKEIRVGSRQVLLGLNTEDERLLEAGARRLGTGLSALAFSLLAFL